TEGTRPGELVHVHGGTEPLDPHRAEVAKGEEAGGELRGVLRDERAPRLRQLLHPLREPHRVALRGVVHAQIVTDRADHHLARVDAHADGEVETAREPQRVRVAAERVGQMERRPAGALRVVLVCDGCAEEGHDAVARVLVYRALEAVHTLGEDREEAVHDAVPFLGVEALRELHRPLHVGEQHRHLLALTLEHAAGAEDLLAEVLRGVRGGRPLGESRRLVQRSAAAPAELLAELGGRAARGTLAAEAAPALRAKAAVSAVPMIARRAAERAVDLHERLGLAGPDVPASPPRVGSVSMTRRASPGPTRS